MADIVSRETRSRMMSGIRGKNTKPEMMIRSGLHALGLRFRLHAKGLPGKPDIVFPRHRAVVFAHGCFWHGHDCRLFRLPATRRDFWKAKIEGNKERDNRTLSQLTAAGWRVAVVWECALKGPGKIPLGDVCEALAAWVRGEGPGVIEFRGLDLSSALA